MIKQENISLSQLIALLINFDLGSAIVVGVAMDAGEDAWLVILVSCIIGLMIVLFIYYLTSLLPGKNLYEIFEYCFQRKIAILLAFLYSLFFFYSATRVLRDFAEMIASEILQVTPLEIILLPLALLIAYILYMGIEVLGRTSEIFTPYVLLFLFLLGIFLFASGDLKLGNIKPILGEGMSSIIKTVFPFELVRPYGQLIAFTCILSAVTNLKFSRRVVVAGIGFSSLLLLFSTLLITMSLGPNTASRSNFPLLSAARLVSIAGFIERIDAFVVFIMMLGILVKSSVFIFSGIKGLEYVFKLPARYFIMPVMCLIVIYSDLIAINFADHVEEGFRILPFVLGMPFEIGFPILLVIVLLFKKWRKEKLLKINGSSS